MIWITWWYETQALSCVMKVVKNNDAHLAIQVSDWPDAKLPSVMHEGSLDSSCTLDIRMYCNVLFAWHAASAPPSYTTRVRSDLRGVCQGEDGALLHTCTQSAIKLCRCCYFCGGASLTPSLCFVVLQLVAKSPCMYGEGNPSDLWFYFVVCVPCMIYCKVLK